MPATSVPWIDRLSRSLLPIPGCSRRRFGVSAMALAIAGQVLPDDALAGCKKPGKKCKKSKDCCNGAKCKKEKCKCKSGRTDCGNTCADLQTDENHCGACNLACASGQTCQGERAPRPETVVRGVAIPMQAAAMRLRSPGEALELTPARSITRPGLPSTALTGCTLRIWITTGFRFS